MPESLAGVLHQRKTLVQPLSILSAIYLLYMLCGFISFNFLEYLDFFTSQCLYIKN